MKTKPKNRAVPDQHKSEETGAAATLRRWESQELAESIKVKEMQAKLSSLRARRAKAETITTAERDLDCAKERWEDTSKLLLSFERGVAPEKREGEKMLVADIESLLENCWRADRIALEQFGLSIAQDAIRCADEQMFYKKYQQSLRDARQNSLRAGIENQHFPAFVMRAYDRSL